MSHATDDGPGLRQRKRAATHQRIADEAARLAADRGVSATTIEDIAAAAQIGRATFFRYFDTKEIAVAEGFSTPWLTLIVDAIASQPAHLAPLDAVVSAFGGFAALLEDQHEQVLHQARLSRSSPGLQAWTLHLYARCEQAIAATVAPRFASLAEDDPRPFLVGALTMAAVRVSVDTWIAADGRTDLARLVRDALLTVQVDGAGPTRASRAPLPRTPKTDLDVTEAAP